MQNCPICDLESGNLISLECDHSFCEQCIKEWFKAKRNCPICRAESNKFPEITAQGIDYDYEEYDNGGDYDLTDSESESESSSDNDNDDYYTSNGGQILDIIDDNLFTSTSITSRASRASRAEFYRNLYPNNHNNYIRGNLRVDVPNPSSIPLSFSNRYVYRDHKFVDNIQHNLNLVRSHLYTDNSDSLDDVFDELVNDNSDSLDDVFDELVNDPVLKFGTDEPMATHNYNNIESQWIETSHINKEGEWDLVPSNIGNFPDALTDKEFDDILNQIIESEFNKNTTVLNKFL